MKSVYKVADACFVNYSTLQDNIFYKRNVNRETDCYKQEIDKSKENHTEGKMVSKQTHLMEIYVEMQKHFQTLNSDLLATTKENERDMFDHRNQQYSTILVAATIMLSALVAVLAQGVLHEDAQDNSFLVIIYSISNSLSMSFLFICDVFCMGVLWRASQFMKNRSRSHYGYLDRAIKKTKEMVRSIRGVKEENHLIGQPSTPSISRKSSSRRNSFDYGSGDSTLMRSNSNRSLGKSPKGHNCKRRNISHMVDADVAEEFGTHEQEMHRYLEQREGIIDKSAYIVSADRGLNIENKSFERFWRESCQFYANGAVLMFYCGSGALIFANGTFVSSTFLFRYRCASGGAITCFIIILTLPLAMTLLIYMRYVEDIGMDFQGDDEDENDMWVLKRRNIFMIFFSPILCSYRLLKRIFHYCNRQYNYSPIGEDNTSYTPFTYNMNINYDNAGNFYDDDSTVDEGISEYSSIPESDETDDSKDRQYYSL